jgi:hypothetical protein
MQKQRKTTGAVLTAVLAVAFASLWFAGGASAKLTGEFTKFQFCPYKTAGVSRCLYSPTTGGEVILGKKKVPIVKEAVLQGGYTEIEEGPEAGYSNFFAATNGQTLTKAPQPVPGGLAGLVNCKEISNFLLRISCEVTFENGLTGVNSTLELARPASEIRINESHLAEGQGVALKLPVMVHLENPFLGESCYIGSSGSPIRWELRTDTTSPPPPNTPITGNPGEIEFLEAARILKIKGAELVDNAWSAPGAQGCGGLFSFIIDPIINSSVGVPAAAGTNTARLKNTIYEATAAAVRKNDESNP